MSENLNNNFLDKTDDRTVNNIDNFVIKVNRLILLSKSKSLKEFVKKKEYTNLTYDQISKPILKHYSFNQKTMQYEWDDKKGIEKEITNVDVVDRIEKIDEKLEKFSNSENKKKKSLLERRIDMRKEHLLILSNKRNIKSFTAVGVLSAEFESMLFEQENSAGFENLSMSDLINLAMADFVKNYS
jgi:hypothetical protein